MNEIEANFGEFEKVAQTFKRLHDAPTIEDEFTLATAAIRAAELSKQIRLRIERLDKKMAMLRSEMDNAKMEFEALHGFAKALEPLVNGANLR